MREGKIFLITLILIVQGSWSSGQPASFPQCYKYHYSDNLNNKLFQDLYADARAYVTNADIDSLEYTFIQMKSLSPNYHPLDEGLLEAQEGVIHYYRGNNSNALRHFLKALSIYSDREFYSGANSMLNNIAIIFSLVGDHHSSKKYLLRAIEINEREGLDYYALFSYNLAEVELMLGNYEESLDILKELLWDEDISLDLISPVSIIASIISAYNNLRMNEEAENWINRGYLAMDENRYTDVDKLNFYTAVMEHHIRNGEYGKVVEIAEKNNIDQRYNLPDQQDHLEYLCRAYAETGDFNTAWHYENILREINAGDNIINREEIINLLMVEYEVNRNRRLKESIDQEMQLNIKRHEASYKLMLTFLIVLIASVILFIILLRIRKIRNQYRKEFNIETEKFAVVNRELQKSNKELEKENKLLDTLISVFAHDLINPFQAILGFSRLMVDDFENLEKDSMEEYSGMLGETAFQLNQILINLQSIATIQKGREKLEISSNKVESIVNKVVALYKPIAEKKRIKISTEVDKSLKAYINSDIMQSVIRNVLHNAIKFSNMGGEIRIRADAEPGIIIIRVEDDGTGMTGEVKSNILSGNYLVSAPGTGMEKGSGLGLSICIDLLKMNNGELDIDNSREKGTTIILKIPRADA
ncbi:MAG: tetratricopeptide repeat-containing sensor histidine kinase [Bacteroidales bacterium]